MRKILGALLAVLLMASLWGIALVPTAKAHTESDPFTTHLIAGKNIYVGDVLVWNDEDYLYVKYVTTDDWYINEVHLEVATSLDGIPQAKGNPIPGKFTYGEEDLWTQEYPFDPIPLNSWTQGTVLYMAAHAVVVHTVSGCIDLYSDASTMVTVGNEEGATYPKSAVEVTGPWETIAGPMGFATNSKWIWETSQVVHPITGDIVEFSKEFTINGLYLVDKTGSLYITADNGYEVSLNGDFIGRAQLAENFRTAGNLKNDIVWWYDTNTPPPANLPYGWATPETWDISDKLTLGLNTLAITGVNEYYNEDEYPYQVGTVENNPAGVRYEAHICYTVVDRKETAWGAGPTFPGKNWATYFTYTVQGWKHLETIMVPANGWPNPTSSTNTLEEGKLYKIVASGTAYAGGKYDTDIEFDAEYSYTWSDHPTDWVDGVAHYEIYGPNLLDLKVEGQFIDWGPFNPNHVYEYTMTGTGTTLTLELVIYDFYPWNNQGSLTVDIYVWE